MPRLACAVVRAEVYLRELLGDLHRSRSELRSFFEMKRSVLEVAIAKRECSELETDLRLAPCIRRRIAEDIELCLIQLRDHRVVAERRIELARGLERRGILWL